MLIFTTIMSKALLKKIKIIASWISNALALVIIIPFMIVVVANQIIIISSEGYLYDSADAIPFNQAALVLGTSHRLRDGSANPYFFNRMEAAANLYHSGKVQYLIASGDNRTKWYNEPEQMRQELIRLGVPDSVIYLDQAGIRTLDSVIRCKKVFGQNSFTVVSQRFHNQRAVYIAQQHGLSAVALNARDLEGQGEHKLRIREWFAKVNVFLDHIMKKQPPYTGERIELGT